MPTKHLKKSPLSISADDARRIQRIHGDVPMDTDNALSLISGYIRRAAYRGNDSVSVSFDGDISRIYFGEVVLELSRAGFFASFSAEPGKDPTVTVCWKW